MEKDIKFTRLLILQKQHKKEKMKKRKIDRKQGSRMKKRKRKQTYNSMKDLKDAFHRLQ